MFIRTNPSPNTPLLSPSSLPSLHCSRLNLQPMHNLRRNCKLNTRIKCLAAHSLEFKTANQSSQQRFVFRNRKAYSDQYHPSMNVDQLTSPNTTPWPMSKRQISQTLSRTSINMILPLQPPLRLELPSIFTPKVFRLVSRPYINPHR